MNQGARGFAQGRFCRYLLATAYNNAWANHRLLTAVSKLDPHEFALPRTGFFPSLKATLNHNVTVDWYYVDAFERSLRGEPVNPAAREVFDPEEPFATSAELHAAQRAVDRRLVDVCAGLTDSHLDTPIEVMRAAGVGRESATRLLGHLFQHQVHHRGQAHAMLAGTPVAPPQLDEFFCAGDAALRAAELAELGYSEAAIWE